MKYIIMCGGDLHGWDAPRQLSEINGEPIIARTVRLLRENGIDDIAITANDNRFREFAPVLDYDSSGTWVNCFMPTETPVCYLMGDVVFSPDAIKTIVETETDGIQMFGSAPPYSPDYIKPWEESFAFKVWDTKWFSDAVKVVKANKSLFAREPLAWELWQFINARDFNTVEHNYIAINDYTCDVDSREDLTKLERIIQKYEVKHG